jgi:hypothetical protein
VGAGEGQGEMFRLLCLLVCLPGVQLQQGTTVTGPFPAHDLRQAEYHNVQEAADQQPKQTQQHVELPGVGVKNALRVRGVEHALGICARRGRLPQMTDPSMKIGRYMAIMRPPPVPREST